MLLSDKAEAIKKNKFYCLRSQKLHIPINFQQLITLLNIS